jgi:hypothetical protein
MRGKLRLRSTNHMCCLGVLCDVVDPTQWNDKFYGRQNNEGLPPKPVQDAAGLRASSRRFGRSDAHEFARINDGSCATFAEIADVVDLIRYDLERHGFVANNK